MSARNDQIIERIVAATQFTGINLSQACKRAGVSYQPTSKQIREGRTIPAETIWSLSKAFGLPLAFFMPPNPTEVGVDAASKLAADANRERTKLTRAGFEIMTDHILDWYRETGGVLKNHHWFADQLDLYEPVDEEDKIMHPISFGENSITTERLMLSGKKDFYNTVGSLGDARIHRAMESHRLVRSRGFVVTDEVIDEEVKGQRLKGGWRKITMRLTTEDGSPVTAVVSKLTWIGK